MKRYLWIFIVISLALSSMSVTKATIISIYIDPGHGGYDGGACVLDINEASLNLDYSKTLKEIFLNNGYKVYLTRDSDISLYRDSNHKKRSDLDERIRLINESDVNVYLSIHMNMYSNSKYSGGQVFYSDILECNKTIATLIQSGLPNTNRVSKMIDSIYLINRVKKPGCLVECGFLSNDEERARLISKSYRDEICMDIYTSLSGYLRQYI